MDLSQPHYFKVLRPEEHEVLKRFGRFAGSPDDERDGFVHLSLAEQLERTLNKHFTEETSVVVLKLSAASLGDAVVLEANESGEAFPHLYGALLTPAVVETTELSRDSVENAWRIVAPTLPPI